MLRTRFFLALMALLVVGCNDHECAQDADCSAGKVCLESGGVFFGGRACIAVTQGVDMGMGDLTVDMSIDMPGPACIPEVDRDLCEASNSTCGEIQVFDRCGMARNVRCGLCRSFETCTDNTCVCVPETDADFCSSRSKNCGLFEATDRCGAMRSVECGMCEDDEECGEQSPNVCGCPCLIGGICIPAGSPNPDNPCQSCQPMLNDIDWSNRDGPCDDGDLCTVDDSCQDGVCAGNPIQCTRTLQCNISQCSPDNGLCEYVPTDEGEMCNDGNLCTIGDVCTSGACVGSPRQCPAQEQCQTSSCSMSTGECVTGNAPNGTPCNDGNSCTSNDQCMNGACTGVQTKNCAKD